MRGADIPPGLVGVPYVTGRPSSVRIHRRGAELLNPLRRDPVRQM